MTRQLSDQGKLDSNVTLSRTIPQRSSTVRNVNEKDVTRKSNEHGHKLDIGSGHALDIGTRHKLDGDTNWRLNSSKELEETRKNDYTGKEPKTN